jgi:hypothetical protein
MSSIVAGTFDHKSDAERAEKELLAAGADQESVCTFALNPPGQHAGTSIGGDHYASPGATHAGDGAAAGAAVGGAVGLGVGLAISPVTGPLGPIGGVAVGAYVGSLAGALEQMDEKDKARPAAEPVPVRPAGVLLAVNVSRSPIEQAALDILRRAGAHTIERAEGTWADGQWEDFDPSSVPHPVEQTSLNS